MICIIYNSINQFNQFNLSNRLTHYCDVDDAGLGVARGVGGHVLDAGGAERERSEMARRFDSWRSERVVVEDGLVPLHVRRQPRPAHELKRQSTHDTACTGRLKVPLHKREW